MVCNESRVGGTVFGLSQNSDGTLLFLSGTEKSAQTALETFDRYARMLGLNI